MERHGFIHEKMDIKILILYVLDQLPAPVEALTLSDIVFCDDGISYFDYSDCLAELVDSGHITAEQGRYQITAEGKENVAAVGSSIPYSVRMKASKLAAPLVAQMKRAAMITADHTLDDDGLCTVHLALSDGISPVIDLRILASSEAVAHSMEQTFQAQAEDIYHRFAAILTESEESK